MSLTTTKLQRSHSVRLVCGRCERSGDSALACIYQGFWISAARWGRCTQKLFRRLSPFTHALPQCRASCMRDSYVMFMYYIPSQRPCENSHCALAVAITALLNSSSQVWLWNTVLSKARSSCGMVAGVRLSYQRDWKRVFVGCWCRAVQAEFSCSFACIMPPKKGAA